MEKKETKKSSKKIETKKIPKKVAKKRVVNKKALKNEAKTVLNKKIDFKYLFKEYGFACILFSLLVTVFNFIFLVISFYLGSFDGFYLLVFDNPLINVIFNTAFDIIFFFILFMFYSICLIEGILKK